MGSGGRVATPCFSIEGFCHDALLAANESDLQRRKVAMNFFSRVAEDEPTPSRIPPRGRRLARSKSKAEPGAPRRDWRRADGNRPSLSPAVPGRMARYA
jgi:hypothetical protein